jgi:hypothetical protein
MPPPRLPEGRWRARDLLAVMVVGRSVQRMSESAGAAAEPLLKKDLPCCRHTLPEAFGIRSNLDRKLGRVIGTVVNGERQIEIAGRSAGVVEDARAD